MTKRRALRFGVIVLAIWLTACSSDSEGTGGAQANGDDPAVATSTTTTLPPNRAPELRVGPTARAEIGRTLSDAIVAIDPDGDTVVVRVSDGPPGFRTTVNTRGLINGFEWEPTEPGQWTVDVSATDDDGLVERAELLLIARNPRNVDLLLAMGDAIAAGFGRDRSDYARPDPCWRSERQSYPAQAFDRLVDAGALASEAEFVTAACSGHLARDLLTTPVPSSTVEAENSEDERSQLDWAIELNPTIVTLTVGLTALGFADLDELLLDPIAGEILELDETALDDRLADVDDALDELLGVLVTHTDAHIALTTSPNPTATDPNGVDGCEGECFRRASAHVVEALNTTIESVARRHPRTRLTVVGFDDAFAFRTAPNGLGPDLLRDVGFGPFDDALGRFTRGALPHCADGDGPPDTLVSSLDCLHPNDEGHVVLGELVVEALARL